MSKSITVDSDVLSHLQSKQQNPDEPLSSVLRRELRRTSLELDDDMYAYLRSRALVIGESASDILRRELGLPAGPVQGHRPMVVVFRIPAGTGAGPWNTRETSVHATVGDTLLLINDDAVGHRLHTSGAPFPHQVDDIVPGGSGEFPLTAPFDGEEPLYDHNFGAGATFWIKVEAQH